MLIVREVEYIGAMEPFVLIIFGVTSNLAKIKLIPALFNLEDKGLIPKESVIIGVARRDWNRREFLNYLNKEVFNSKKLIFKNPDKFSSLVQKMSYIKGDLDQNGDNKVYEEIKQILNKSEFKRHNHLYYLATYPKLYSSIFKSLQINKLTNKNDGWVRLMVEKPIGESFSSAKELNRLMCEYFAEEQIYRLDHYLGKETIQNILVFRFGNGLLQPMMNKNYIDHIQITASESFGVEDRGGYFDTMGSFKDVGQNHLLQMLIAATMNAPKEFNNREVTDERIRILKHLKARPDKIVFGQYNGYLYEQNVAENSNADTFFALKTEVETPEWKGVPIYIRSGKKLAKSVAEISLVFKIPESNLFQRDELSQKPNILTYRLQPNEGIGLEILTKKPGHKFLLDHDYLQFCYRNDANSTYDPYEKLIYDAMTGDPTFFNDSPEVEASWKFVDKYLKGKKELHVYEPGSWGPPEAESLIEKDGRKWIEPSELLCKL